MQKIMKILLKFGEILMKFWQNFDKILTKAIGLHIDGRLLTPTAREGPRKRARSFFS